MFNSQGEYVYATIPSYICNRFRPKILDGKIHIIKKFDIVPNKREYRVVGDKDITIPLHRFDFVQFHHLDHRRDNHYVLTDLYGVIVNEIEKANYFAIEIEDLMYVSFSCLICKIKLISFHIYF
ncbi:hypothetical protein RND81_04G045200 [Saponaria officinalis]|uniref:Uncharacterized protein n=1 Tax=Saponaria officinalis TaxID=3572 RepID=A0AAW1LHZ5_SAPOF